VEGALQFVPRAEGYGPEFNQADFGLTPLPRVEIHEGLIFASLDPGAPSLRDYFLGIAPYLSYVAAGGSRKLQVLGYYEYTYDANWKLICENTVDDYHAQYLHGLAFAQRAKIQNQVKRGAHMEGANSREFEKTRRSHDCGMHGAIEWEAASEDLRLQDERKRHVHLGVFPSLVMLYHPVLDLTNLRVVKPIGVERTKVVTYCLGPAGADESHKNQIAENFNSLFGPCGRVGVDDILAFAQVQRGLKARTGGDVLVTRGVQRADGWAADEHAIRSFWNGWRRYMAEPAESPAAAMPAAASDRRGPVSAQTGRR
jgi:p-cumate 2,3-dioxygenase alpha subunit